MRIPAILAALAGVTLASSTLQAQIEKVTPDELDAVPSGHQDIARGLGPVGGNKSGRNANDRGGPPGAGGPGGPGGGGPGGPGGGPGGPPGASAGPAPTPSADPHDLRGTWNGRATQRSYEANARPGPVVKSKYELALLCLADPGVEPAGGEIFQTDKVITWVATGMDSHLRRIYLNAEHPKDLKPTYMGHSVGHWDGDTLVVDTVGLQGVFEYFGTKHHTPGKDIYDQVTTKGEKLPPPTQYFDNTVVMASPTLHVVERLRKINGNTQLQDDLSFEDPATGMKPYTMQAIFTLSQSGEYLEQFCEDGNDLFGPQYADSQK
ncbi:MAG: hypothetical protein QM718_02325 [Steroidobacteraceae bacterium]